MNVLTGLPYSVVALLLPRNKHLVIINSTHNHNFNHNSKYLFEYYLEHKEQYSLEVLFVMNDKEKREELAIRYGPFFIDNKTLKNKIRILKAYFWVTSTLDTPIGGVFYRHRRHVLHMSHGMPFKNILFLELNLSFVKKVYYFLSKLNFTHYLASSDFYKPVIRKCLHCTSDQVLVLPQPKVDAVRGKIKSLSIVKQEVLENARVEFGFSAKNVIYAPTWRHYEETRFFPFDDSINDLDDFLHTSDIVIWIREHPFFSLNTSEKCFRNIRSFSAQDFVDISEYLVLFDALITDYSSIAFDFMLLKRPIIYLQYDLEKYQKEVGLIREYESLMAGKAINSYSEFKTALLSVGNEIPCEQYTEVYRRANMNPPSQSASKVVLDYLESTANGLACR